MSQTLYYQGTEHNSVEKDYVLCDGDGLFISFTSAQAAFDWMEKHTPGRVTEVRIEPMVARRSITMTEGEIEFVPRSDISVFHSECKKCGKVFDDRFVMYYPCPEHPSV